MASTKLKTAYVFFFASFLAWLSLFFYVCFPSGVWSTPVRFPNSSSFMLFFGSAIVAVVSCLVIGLNHMGLGLRLKSRSEEAPQTSNLNTTIAVSQPASSLCVREDELQVSTDGEERPTILVLPQLEEEQQASS
jgi:hypothetical protein